MIGYLSCVAQLQFDGQLLEDAIFNPPSRSLVESELFGDVGTSFTLYWDRCWLQVRRHECLDYVSKAYLMRSNNQMIE